MNISRQDCRVCSKTSIYYIYVFSIDVNIVAYMYMYKRNYCCVYVYVKTVILWRICKCKDVDIVAYMYM